MSQAYSVTVKGGFWEQYGTTISPAATTSRSRRRVAQLLGEKGVRDLRARMDALNGVVAGSNATATNARIVAAEELGGVRAIETETLINRNTTAGDVTEIDTDLYSLTGRTTMASPANLDGNPLGTR